MTSPLQQKLKINGPVVVTANRVGDGVVIYRTASSCWSTDLDEAAVVNTAPAATELLGAAAADGINAVDPYVAPVERAADGRLRPGNLRECIRRLGPTIVLPTPFAV